MRASHARCIPPAVIFLTLFLIVVSSGLLVSPRKADASGFPTIRDPAVNRAQARTASDEAFRRSSEGVRARGDSQSAYKNLSAGDAASLARDTFGWVFDDAAAPALQLRAKERVSRYLGDNEALIDDGDGHLAAAYSPLPLRSSVGNASKAPVDLSLRDTGGGFSPKNPVVPLSLPGDAGGALRLPLSGISIEPKSAGKSAGRLVGDRVLYANAHPDTDLLMGAVTGGAEISAQLRSPASPEALSFHLNLPAGAHLALERSDAPIVKVVRRDAVLAVISPPLVLDAQKAQVPSDYEVSGNSLTVRINHRGGSYAYPIMLDPQITESWSWSNGATSDTSGWAHRIANASYPYNFQFGNKGFGNGLNVWNNTNTNYPAWQSVGMWYWPSPGDSYVYRVDYGNQLMWALSGNACTQEGIWVATSGWDPGELAFCSGFSHTLDTYCANANCSPYPARNPNNEAVFSLSNGGLVGANGDLAVLGNPKIYLGDDGRPSVKRNPPWSTSWVANVTRTFTMTASDSGLGATKMGLRVPLAAGGSRDDNRTRTCSTNTPQTLCYQTAWQQSFSYSTTDLPEGDNTIAASATDLVGNTNSGGVNSPDYGAQTGTDTGLNVWHEQVDRSGPVLTPSGTLWDHRNQTTDHRNEGLYDASYTASVQATDGSTASSSSKRSGVHDIRFQLINSSNATVADSTDPNPQACPASSCGETRSWTINSDAYPDGDYTVKAIATDEAGNSTTTTWSVTIDRQGDIYHATSWEGDPSTSATTGEEYAELNTQNMRHLSDNALVTRNLAACLSDASGCAQERSQTRSGQSTSGTSDDYAITTGTSHDDARLVDDSELLAPANSALGTPAQSGPLTDALQMWQRPPPAHGDAYDLYTTTQQTVTDEQPADEVRKLWVDSHTKMPLHVQTSVGGTVESDVYYVYDEGRLKTSDVSSDFFAAPAPANLGDTTTIDLPLTDVPDSPDPPPPTEDEQIADAQALRADLGLPNDYTYVKSLFDDPTLDNGTDAYGIPVTAAERTDLDARVAAEEDLSVIDDYATVHSPDTYAGIYIDQQNAGAIYVGFTSNVDANMSAIKAVYPHPELLHPFPVTPQRTLQQLDDLQTQVEADLESGSLNGLGINSVGEDEESNQVVVTAPDPTAADQAAIAARYGSGVTLEQRDVSLADTAATHHTPPNIGGLKIRSLQESQGFDYEVHCTSGFGAVKHYNTNGHKGNEYFDVSAGHCLKSTDEPGNSKHGYGLRWYHNGSHLFGITITNTLVPAGKKTSADGMSVQVLAGTQSNRIYVREGKAATPHLVRIKSEATHFHKGQIACHSGFATRREFCGRVLRTNVTDYLTGNGTVVRHQVEVKMSACGAHAGDSGGPAFHGHSAYGILRAAATTKGRCPSGSFNYFVFTKIGANLSDLGGLQLLK